MVDYETIINSRSHVYHQFWNLRINIKHLTWHDVYQIYIKTYLLKTVELIQKDLNLKREKLRIGIMKMHTK
jgi:hypothetical protein